MSKIARYEGLWGNLVNNGPWSLLSIYSSHTKHEERNADDAAHTLWEESHGRSAI